MRQMRSGDGIARRRPRFGTGSDLGQCLIAAACILCLPTVLTLPPGERTSAGLVVLGLFCVGLLLGRLSWRDAPSRWLLVWPVTMLAGLLLLVAVTRSGAVSTLSGLPVLAFFYVGFTQRRGTGVVLLPLALVTWALCYGHHQMHDLLLRLPITVGVWAIVSEALAQLRHRLREVTTTLRAQALQDALTGLSSRRAFDLYLPLVTSGDAVVFVDLDHFKRLNDEHGHVAGDDVLRDFGAALRAALRTSDVGARYGGEEFVLLLADAHVSGAESLLARLRDEWRVQRPEVTFSAGVAVVGPDGDANRAVAAADAALYRAKAAGRNRVELSRH
jgi:diguanylate cyclase (GGDEF)-like protein